MCSTPVGVIAVCVRCLGVYAGPLVVLNACRRHCCLRTIPGEYDAECYRCSTPVGVIAVCVPGKLGQISRSWECSTPVGVIAVCVRFGQCSSRSLIVLNACRRHCCLRTSSWRPLIGLAMCSTPVGVIAVCVRVGKAIAMGRPKCSTPVGVIAVCVVTRGSGRAAVCRAQRLSASLLSACFTTDGACVQEDCAQRLSASLLSACEICQP